MSFVLLPDDCKSSRYSAVSPGKEQKEVMISVMKSEEASKMIKSSYIRVLFVALARKIKQFLEVLSTAQRKKLTTQALLVVTTHFVQEAYPDDRIISLAVELLRMHL